MITSSQTQIIVHILAAYFEEDRIQVLLLFLTISFSFISFQQSAESVL